MTAVKLALPSAIRCFGIPSLLSNGGIVGGRQSELARGARHGGIERDAAGPAGVDRELQRRLTQLDQRQFTELQSAADVAIEHIRAAAFAGGARHRNEIARASIEARPRPHLGEHVITPRRFEQRAGLGRGGGEQFALLVHAGSCALRRIEQAHWASLMSHRRYWDF